MQSKRILTEELVKRENQYSFYKYLGILPNPDRILRSGGKSIQTFRELKNDPHVWSCIQSRKSGLLSLENRIIPNSVSSSILKELENILDDIDLNQVFRDILEAPLFGYQPMEILWDLSAGSRKYFPKQIIAKPQEWFAYDSSGNFRYKTFGSREGEIVPPMKIINVQYESSYLNPYGESLLAKCFWPVTFKNGGLRFWVNFMEKYGMPLLLGQYTRGATFEESGRLAEELANMTEDAVIVAPSDIKIEMKEAVRSTSVSLYKELINNCNAEISKALLSQTLTTEIVTGSYAAAETHFKIRREVILSDIRLVESVMNTVLKYIMDLNYQENNYPKFEIIMNDAENYQKVDRDIKLVQSGCLKLTKQYWMETYGFKEEEIVNS